MLPLLLTLALFPSAASQSSTPKAVVSKLPSGVMLVVERNASTPTVAIEVMVRAGSARETASQAGCAHLLEHLAFAGTPSHPGDAIDKRAGELGYSLEANTQSEIVRYFTSCLKADWLEVLGLLADAVVNLAPTEEVFRRHQRVVLQELIGRRDNPLLFLSEHVHVLAYPSSGYGRGAAGSLEDVRRRTLEDVREFHKRWYTTGNTVVAIVGDVDPGEAAKQVEVWFGGLRRAAGEPFEAPPPPGAKVVDEVGPYTKAAAAFAYPAIPASRIEDSAALDVLVALLQERAATGPLKDYALAFQAQYQTLSHPGLVVASLFCDEERAKDATAKLAEEIGRLRSGSFTETEFIAARNRVRAQELYATETNAGRAHALGYWLIVGGEGIAERYLAALNTLSVGDARRVGAEVFDPAKEIRVQWHPPKGGGR
ncbi:MAG: insulinase family protein [Fimbriimonadia bacterium]|jgi:zinc protease